MEKKTYKVLVEPHHFLSNWFEVHTDFDLKANPSLEMILGSIHGIETLFYHERYKFTYITGKMFDGEIVTAQVLEKVEQYFND